jgi:hypothetical protein
VDRAKPFDIPKREVYGKHTRRLELTMERQASTANRLRTSRLIQQPLQALESAVGQLSSAATAAHSPAHLATLRWETIRTEGSKPFRPGRSAIGSGRAGSAKASRAIPLSPRHPVSSVHG